MQKTEARAVGFLFLMAMAVSIAGNVLILPIVADADFLQAVLDNAGRIRIAGI